MVLRLWTLSLIFLSVLQFSDWGQAQSAAPTKIWTQEAQAGADEVEIYTDADFDSEVITTIKPGKYYWISSKPEGPFYKILLAPNQVGYVPDTELDIKGRGPFQPKNYLGDEEEVKPGKNANKGKTKKPVRQEKTDDDEVDGQVGKNHLLAMNLINYHEETLGGIQVGDLWALEYKNLAWGAEEADYGMGGLSWNVMAALSAPDYYKKKTGYEATGTVLWGGVQFQNYTLANSHGQIRYGLGPFLKYSQFNVQSNLAGTLKKYSLNDATVGVTLEAAFQLLWSSIGIDLGLRYYWDKTPYGVLSVGILF